MGSIEVFGQCQQHHQIINKMGFRILVRICQQFKEILCASVREKQMICIRLLFFVSHIHPCHVHEVAEKRATQLHTLAMDAIQKEEHAYSIYGRRTL